MRTWSDDAQVSVMKHSTSTATKKRRNGAWPGAGPGARGVLTDVWRPARAALKVIYIGVSGTRYVWQSGAAVMTSYVT